MICKNISLKICHRISMVTVSQCEELDNTLDVSQHLLKRRENSREKIKSTIKPEGIAMDKFNG